MIKILFVCHGNIIKKSQKSLWHNDFSVLVG